MPVERTLDKLERLLDLQETYETYLNSIPTGMLVVDEWFHIQFVNNPLLDMSCYTRKELLGAHISILMPKEDAKIHREHERDFDRNPRIRVGNHGLKPVLRTNKGNLVPIDVTLSTMEIRGGRYHMANIRTMQSLHESIGV